MKKTATTPKYKTGTKAKAKPAPAPEAAAPSSPMPTGDAVAVGAAKGRPMLQWVGKRPLRSVTAFPAQLVETFDPVHETEDGTRNTGNPNLLFHGDNKEVLAHLLANGYRGKIDLVYIDPPFDSGADYVRNISLRGKSATAKLDGEGYSLGEQTQYEDIWANDQYLQFMYERLILLKELMAEDASIWLHCDPKRNYQLRFLLDEILGQDAFQNEVVWWYWNKMQGNVNRFAANHDTLLVYQKGSPPFQAIREQREDAIRQLKRAWDPKSNKLVNAKDSEGNLIYIESESKTLADVWMIPMLQPADETENLRFPTQKREEILAVLITAMSRPSSLILDCFSGSGTTAAVAQKLARRWIGCDINKGAIQTTSKRLQEIIRDQIEEKKKREAQGELIKAEDPPPEPAALSFHVYRVNDYDLQIQHNEAVALACEHIGVTRSRTDGFFDGTQGKRLVKIVPFNHPLSPLDLEEVVRELKARKNEERDILLVCLGKELAADAWLEHYNQMRKKGSIPNKIEVIELRTDPKYGKFIAHKPAAAKVAIRRKSDEIHVEIHDFMSPSILERLETQADLLTPQIKDWRAMVDCVMIDTAFDGAVFNIALSDIPEKKADFVQGTYTLPAPKGETAVAVKIIDMLGEEVVVTQKV